MNTNILGDTVYSQSFAELALCRKLMRGCFLAALYVEKKERAEVFLGCSDVHLHITYSRAADSEETAAEDRRQE